MGSMDAPHRVLQTYGSRFSKFEIVIEVGGKTFFWEIIKILYNMLV